MNVQRSTTSGTHSCCSRSRRSARGSRSVIHEVGDSNGSNMIDIAWDEANRRSIFEITGTCSRTVRSAFVSESCTTWVSIANQEAIIITIIGRVRRNGWTARLLRTSKLIGPAVFIETDPIASRAREVDCSCRRGVKTSGGRRGRGRGLYICQFDNRESVRLAQSTLLFLTHRAPHTKDHVLWLSWSE